MGLLDLLLRGRKAAPEARARSSGGVVPWTLPGEGSNRKRMNDYTSYLDAITIKNVYKATSVIATNFSSVDMRLLDRDDQATAIAEAEPALGALIARPNPEMKGRVFRQFQALDYCLTGNSITALDTFDGMGRPTEMYRLNPAAVRIVRSDIGKLAYGYEVEIDNQIKVVWYDGADILHVKFADPRRKDNLWGVGAVEAGAAGLDTDRRVGEFLFNYFNRGAILTGVIEHDDVIPEDERRSLIEGWKAQLGGTGNKFKTALLWAGARFKAIQEPMGNIPVVDLSRMGRNDVLELFGVPPQMVGDFEHTNYRNAQEANAFFWSETIAPMLNQFEEDFWTDLVAFFDDRTRPSYQRPEVIDFAMRAESAQKLGATGGFTVNELHVAAGFDPLPPDQEVGDYLVIPRGYMLLHPDDAAEYAQAQIAPPTLPQPPSITEVAGPSAAASQTQEQQAPALPAPGGKARSPDTPPRAFPRGLLSREARAAQDRAQMASHSPRLRVIEGHKAEDEGVS